LALQLPPRSRLKLAAELLSSVEASVTQEDILQEAAKRDGELECGRVKALNEAEFWSGIASRKRPA
jgi:hypothetical protein